MSRLATILLNTYKNMPRDTRVLAFAGHQYSVQVQKLATRDLITYYQRAIKYNDWKPTGGLVADFRLSHVMVPIWIRLLWR